MSTPRGRQFQLRLPDGSAVWLNAASTIRYPAAFAGNERKVELTGEAYFEVAPDQQRPFRVLTPKQQIEVMGTHFNVNAYADEPLEQTTLIEGSVKVSGAVSQLSKLLTPDHQASVSDGAITVTKLDTGPVIAWKNGLFCFVNANVPGVMRQLSRWYDIEVQYEGKIPDRVFAGKMQRDLTLNEMLNLLSSLNLNFKLEGSKKLIVKP
nr:FecR family protein [Pseudoflavitalea sp. G-6-1-2]